MEFEWDPDKSASNLTKHGVTFLEAMSAFADPFELTIDDPAHSEGEFRFISLGYSSDGRLLAVGYTERGESIRIIHAREASPRERKHYESRRPPFH